MAHKWSVSEDITLVRIERRGHDLGPALAAHLWWRRTPMATQARIKHLKACGAWEAYSQREHYDEEARRLLNEGRSMPSHGTTGEP